MSEELFVPGGANQPKKRGVLAAIFYSDEGPRVWWRILLFIVLTVGGAAGLGTLMFHLGIIARSTAPGAMTPNGLVGQELLFAIPALAAGILLGLIEHRSLASYGLPAGGGQPQRIFPGIVWGVGMMTVLALLIRAFGGIQFSGLAIHGSELAKSATLYGVGFLLVGFFEEFTFRGYLQKALGERIGFWPAAAIWSTLFGAIHLGNTGESWVGGLMAGLFGIVSCLALQRTGSLWLSIGMHAGFDYTETFIFGVPDSGFPAKSALINSVLHGPRWLTGGSVGPEASVMAFVMLGATFALLWISYPSQAPVSPERAFG
jgi:membrane protease YdiL (CAAX protease family)